MMEEDTLVEEPVLEENTQALTTPLADEANSEPYESSKAQVDTVFLKFQHILSRAPAQILRYLRVYDEDEVLHELEPLVMSHRVILSQPILEDPPPAGLTPTEAPSSSSTDPGRTLDGTVPPCPRCGAQRHPEFQLLSTLISLLGLPPTHPSYEMDWGILTIYTCSMDCAAALEEYVPERLLVQYL